MVVDPETLHGKLYFFTPVVLLPMTPTSFLIVLCSIALLSLVAVSLANQREIKTRSIRAKLRTLKGKLESMEDLVIKLDKLLESRVIARLINEEIIDMAEGMIQLDRDATYLRATLSNAEQRANELNDEGAYREISRLVESDAQIARYQHAINEAGLLLKRLHASNKISQAELETFIGELSWCHLMVETISIIGQGQKSMKRKDPVSAQSFYKRARQTLIASSDSDPRRHRFIKEISELINNKRTSLSEDLMHENV